MRGRTRTSAGRSSSSDARARRCPRSRPRCGSIPRSATSAAFWTPVPAAIPGPGRRRRDRRTGDAGAGHGVPDPGLDAPPGPIFHAAWHGRAVGLAVGRTPVTTFQRVSGRPGSGPRFATHADDMKKSLLALCTATLAFLVVAALVSAAGYYSASVREGEAKAYVDRIVPAVVGRWSTGDLLANASRDMLRDVTLDRIDSLFAAFSKRLGRLQSYGGSQREGFFFRLTMRGRVLTYVYLVTARFERGPAQIRVRAVWRDGEWKLSDFYVFSDTLVLR